MSDLSSTEKRKLEQLLGMSGGYVLGFSNRTFDDFFFEKIGRSIYPGSSFPPPSSSRATY